MAVACVGAAFRDLPDAEEAEDMVDAQGVEIFFEPYDALFPPLEAVFFHRCPVVGGETPVLTLRREAVRRSAGFHVEVEEMRMLFHVVALTVHPNG